MTPLWGKRYICASHGVSPRDRWLRVLPRGQMNVNVNVNVCVKNCCHRRFRRYDENSANGCVSGREGPETNKRTTQTSCKLGDKQNSRIG